MDKNGDFTGRLKLEYFDREELSEDEIFEEGFFHADPHPSNLVVLEDNATGTFEADGACHLMLCGGATLEGERHIWWNFVHSDPGRIEWAKQQWIEQRFPVVPDDHDVYVPLPSG